MKVWLVLAGLIVASPAGAIPPVEAPGVPQFIQAYIRADTNNDLKSYADLFAPNAKITAETGVSFDKDEWIRNVSLDFAQDRHARIIDVFSDGGRPDGGGQPVRILIVEAVRICQPHSVECNPHYQSEALTVTAGRIISLERQGGLTIRFTPEGRLAPLE